MCEFRNYSKEVLADFMNAVKHRQPVTVNELRETVKRPTGLSDFYRMAQLLQINKKIDYVTGRELVYRARKIFGLNSQHRKDVFKRGVPTKNHKYIVLPDYVVGLNNSGL